MIDLEINPTKNIAKNSFIEVEQSPDDFTQTTIPLCDIIEIRKVLKKKPKLLNSFNTLLNIKKDCSSNKEMTIETYISLLELLEQRKEEVEKLHLIISKFDK
jgi:hypothetical protein